MATKRSDGGSNIGLIVTLVFFVLLSVIVSVLAYMGFDGQAKLKTEKESAETKEKNAEKKMRWYRFQAHLYRSYMGHPVDKDALTQLKNSKSQFDAGNFPDAEGADDKADVEKLNKQLAGAMAWDAEKSDAPEATYEKRLQALDTKANALASAASDAATAQKAAEEGRATAESMQKAAEGQATKVRTDNDKAKTDYQDFTKAVGTRIDNSINVVTKTLGDVRTEKAAVENERDKLLKSIRTLEARVNKASTDLKTARDELDEAKNRLQAVADKAGLDIRQIGAETFDAKATEMLKSWNRNWQIVAMDRKGTMPYINLGSSDGVTPQVTFSIHSVGADGKLNPTPKGTLEVVRVINDKQARARVTSVKDAKNDPILKGDRLFNATWDPNRKKHVAIAGLADLGGDGTDSSEDFRRLMKRQGVVLDAYIDTKDDKAPKIEGDKKKVDQNTDYLILGEGLEPLNHPKYRDAKYNKEFADLTKKLKDQAAASGVTVLTLRKYLDLIGYRAPKVVSSGGSSNR